MREAVIVSTARTPIGKAYRGAFNNTDGPTLGGHAIRHAVNRAGLEPAEIEDVAWGCAMPQGTQGRNIARLAALRAGLPVTTAAITVDRQCSSGMMAIATAARTVMFEGVDIMVAGGQESISLVQNEHMNSFRADDPALVAMHKDVYMAMLDTAEVVARRYNISREAQDAFGLQSQQRTAAAQEAGRFDDEIVPLPSKMGVMDKETGEISFRD
ncbi:MAG: beta-ketoacyl synthase N-terminal-like domain-containing protein, partial [Xanthomonadales bacterium]|nr:beta-ketoacyl synthase N-terminal-like domain-containing protein [Xanthomonadales bacterium]